MSTAAAVSIKSANVAFGGVYAVKDLSLDIFDGEIVAVVGPNGSGKTTLLNVVSGFVRVNEGNVSLYGDDVSRLAPHRRARMGLGRTFQNLRIVPRITVSELLQFGWHQRDPRGFAQALVRPFWLESTTGSARQEAARALERVGLGADLLDVRVASLSQGQVKLVDIARALMAGPKVLLLDEPTSGLGRSDIQDMAELIKELRRDGVTAALVEHDMKFVRSLVDRVVVMMDGQVLAQGQPDVTLALPEVVDAYLGRPRGDADHVPF